MQVKDIMTREPVCCTKHTGLTDVAGMMRDKDCGAIPVVETNATGNKLVGIVTDRDIIVRAVADGADLSKLSAGDCMSMVVATVTPETGLEDCERVMAEHKIRRIPVVDGKGDCVGIVAQADLARHAPSRETGKVVREVSQPSPESPQGAGEVDHA